MPDKVTDALAHQKEEYNDTRWDDVVESEDNPQGMAKILRLYNTRDQQRDFAGRYFQLLSWIIRRQL